MEMIASHRPKIETQGNQNGYIFIYLIQDNFQIWNPRYTFYTALTSYIHTLLTTGNCSA